MKEQLTKAEEFLTKAWENYLTTVPQVKKIVDYFQGLGESIVNDHIALRTLEGPKTGLDFLTKKFEEMGLRPALKKEDEYLFPEKKLRANYYIHPTSPDFPRIFVSELSLKQLGGQSELIFNNILSNLERELDLFDFTKSHRPWKIEIKTYQKLLEESEYAAWVYALGFRVNHFTVSVNHLKTIKSIEEVNHYLKNWGLLLNNAGGEIKGHPKQGLVQSSTMADKMNVQFEDGILSIPTCYYEFAQRFPVDQNRPDLFQGFIPTSADKIFESTSTY